MKNVLKISQNQQTCVLNILRISFAQKHIIELGASMAIRKVAKHNQVYFSYRNSHYSHIISQKFKIYDLFSCQTYYFISG